jgi:hypothetical protein
MELPAAHAQAPVELGVHIAVAVVAAEDSVVDEIFGKRLAVFSERLGDKIIVRSGQRHSIIRVQGRDCAHPLPCPRWSPCQWADERFGVCGRRHLDKQFQIFRSKQVLDWHTQIHEVVHGSTKLVELMLAIGKKIMVLLELVQGADLADDIVVRGTNLPLSVSELGADHS